MYKKWLFLVGCALFAPTILIAKNSVLLDANTRQPLPYATIVFPQTHKGLYADSVGRFSVPAGYSVKDSICIQMLGYTDVCLLIGGLRDTVLLAPTAYTLQKIVVRPKYKKIQLGDLKKKRKDVYHSYGKMFFTPMTIAVNILNAQYAGCYIAKLHYRYNHPNPAIRHLVRPQLYVVDSDGGPGVPLLQQSRTIEIAGKGVLEIDISDESIIFPDSGVFIGIDIIEEINSNDLTKLGDKRWPFPFFEDPSKKVKVYGRELADFKWTYVDNSAIDLYINYPFALSLNCPY